MEMEIIFNTDGSIKNKDLGRFINQHSDNINVNIKIYDSQTETYIQASDYNVIAHFELPNKTTTENTPLPMPSGDGYIVNLSNVETYYYGILKMSLSISGVNYNWTYPVNFIINETTDYSGQTITLNEYQILNNYIQDIISGNIVVDKARKNADGVPILTSYAKTIEAPTNSTLTNDEKALFTSGVFINGIFNGLKNPIIYPAYLKDGVWHGFFSASYQSGNPFSTIGVYEINDETNQFISQNKIIATSDGKINLSDINVINGKGWVKKINAPDDVSDLSDEQVQDITSGCFMDGYVGDYVNPVFFPAKYVADEDKYKGIVICADEPNGYTAFFNYVIESNQLSITDNLLQFNSDGTLTFTLNSIDNLTINDKTYYGGNIVYVGSLGNGQILYFHSPSGTISFGGFRPEYDNTWDLGLESRKWKNLFLSDNIYIKKEGVSGLTKGFKLTNQGWYTEMYQEGAGTLTFSSSGFIPSSTSLNLGSSSQKWGDLYLNGSINGYGWVKQIPAPASTTLTDTEKTNIVDGTFIKGSFLGFTNPVFYPAKLFTSGVYSGQYVGMVMGVRDNNYFYMGTYAINSQNNINFETTAFFISETGNVNIVAVDDFEGKTLPSYPSDTGTFVLKCVNGTLTWVQE